jgi:hypothetical protein
MFVSKISREKLAFSSDLTHTLSLIHTLILSLSLTHTDTHTHTHTLSLSPSLSLSLSHTHTHTHTVPGTATTKDYLEYISLCMSL